MDSLITQAKQDFDTAILHFEEELHGLRTGRAHAGLLQSVEVESYGQKVPLKHVANVAAQDSKTLVITPWDRSQLQAIEKGIQVANLGLNPSSDGSVVRIGIPAMTEERRKELVKIVGQSAEKARIAVRNIREEVIKSAKRLESEGGVSKDELAVTQEKLQKVVDTVNSEIKKLAEDKEQEILTV